MQLNPYLYYNGDCEAAFKFYEAALGGKITAMMTHEGSPAAGQAPAVDPPRGMQRLGFMESEFTVPDDFDTMFQDEIIAMSEGGYKGKM